MKNHDTILPSLKPTARPLLIPGAMMRRVVDQVTRNTVALGGPRGFTDQIAADQGGAVLVDTQQDAIDAITAADAASFFGDQVWTEIAQNLEEQRITNPTDSEQYLDVDHRTISLFRVSTGQLVVMRFKTPAAAV